MKPNKQKKEEKKPNPGSKEAIALGCKCPVYDNHHGKGIPLGDEENSFWISDLCPIHANPKPSPTVEEEFAKDINVPSKEEEKCDCHCGECDYADNSRHCGNTKCGNKPPQPEVEGWEKALYKRYWLDQNRSLCYEEIKDFIKPLLEKTKQEAYREGREDERIYK